MTKILFEYVDHMGEDARTVDAARMSFEKDSTHYTKEKNDKLITYLQDHDHWVPKAHNQVTFKVKMPVFLARQYFKHIIGSVKSEASRRYVQSTPEFYTPIWRSKPEGSIKQGSGDEVDNVLKAAADHYMKVSTDQAIGAYNYMLRAGIAPEQARSVLPQSMMVSVMDTGSLEYWGRMYKQRTHPSAQKEWKYITDPLNEKMMELYPVTWGSLVGKSED